MATENIENVGLDSELDVELEVEQSHVSAVPNADSKKKEGGIRLVVTAVAVGLSAVWLVASIVLGMGVMEEPKTASPGFKPNIPALEPRSYAMAYGGDAYTGIQNAASATEHAVLESAGAMISIDADLTIGLAAYQRDAALAVSAPIQRGLGLLIIASGVGTFAITLALAGSSVPTMKRKSAAPEA